jgi:hypothetical protein
VKEEKTISFTLLRGTSRGVEVFVSMGSKTVGV